jgi:hypothetical protein
MKTKLRLIYRKSNHQRPGGFFISYHAYPYYPDFVSQQTSYQIFLIITARTVTWVI